MVDGKQLSVAIIGPYKAVKSSGTFARFCDPSGVGDVLAFAIRGCRRRLLNPRLISVIAPRCKSGCASGDVSLKNAGALMGTLWNFRKTYGQETPRSPSP
jgi:hypothetical protein